MAWIIAFLGLVASGLFFAGAGICIFKYNKIWLKRCVAGFMCSFIIAFIAVGLH
ncbi:MAG: hypothetical protein GX295_09740 [Syntrophomonadaceae bacterium]|nr:hypothetical protein [Syntrophomonadaceae bacterium]